MHEKRYLHYLIHNYCLGNSRTSILHDIILCTLRSSVFLLGESRIKKRRHKRCHGAWFQSRKSSLLRTSKISNLDPVLPSQLFSALWGKIIVSLSSSVGKTQIAATTIAGLCFWLPSRYTVNIQVYLTLSYLNKSCLRCLDIIPWMSGPIHRT
jgi:hypothetical protein